MTKKFHFLELDDASRDYLLAVRDRKGVGLPGIYVGQSNYLPLIGFIAGIVLVGAVVIISWTNIILDDPLNVAMLQTAGLLLGGWMMIAAIRVWMMSGGRRHAGHFLWVDPLRLWEAAGSKVTVTDLADLNDATATDNYNEGTYQNTTIELKLPEGQHTFTVPKQEDGERLLRFFNALSVFKEVKVEEGGGAAAAMIGSMARDLASGEPPTLEAVDEPDSREPTHLPEPHRAQRAPSGILAYLAIIGAAVVLVLLLRSINVMLRDDAIFDLVKMQRPPMLRAYLVDPRNTRHRDEVKQILIRHYAPSIQRVQQNGRDPELKAQLLAILEKIQTEPTPVVSIRVREEVEDPQRAQNFEAGEVRSREEAIQRQIGDALCQIVGDELLVFVQAPEDVPPMIEVVYRFVPEENGNCRFEWRCVMRTGPEDEQPKTKTREPQVGVPLNNALFNDALRNAAQQTIADLAGDPANVNAPPPVFPPLPG